MRANATLHRSSSTEGSRGRRGRLVLLAAVVTTALGLTAAASAEPSAGPGRPDLGPNVVIFDPSMPTSQIQARVDAIAAQQVPNQFGTQRYALLFKPGTYGTAAAVPLNFQVGYYTEVAGLGRSPGDVVINGSVYVRNQCDASGCVALNNFWRSLSNLTINVNTPGFGCYSGEFWAVSQAAPMRRVHVNGLDHADGLLHRAVVRERRLHRRLAVRRKHVVNGSQQQWLVRNSTLDGWIERRLEPGVLRRRRRTRPVLPRQATCGGPYTTLATSPVTREAPYLYVDARRAATRCSSPPSQRDSAGTSWAAGPTAGRSVPIDDFFIAQPDGRREGDQQRARPAARTCIFTPGVYELDKTIEVKRPDTVVLGLGFATLVPDQRRRRR